VTLAAARSILVSCRRGVDYPPLVSSSKSPGVHRARLGKVSVETPRTELVWAARYPLPDSHLRRGSIFTAARANHRQIHGNNPSRTFALPSAWCCTRPIRGWWLGAPNLELRQWSPPRGIIAPPACLVVGEEMAIGR
jgi:hypothetical protein